MDEYREDTSAGEAAADDPHDYTDRVVPELTEMPGEIDSIAQDDAVDEAEATIVKTRPGWRELFCALAVIWPAEVFVGIAVVGISRARGYESFTENGLNIDPLAIVIMMPFSAVVTLLACWLFACRRFGRTFRDGMYFYPVSWSTSKLSVLLGVGWSIVGMLVAALFTTGDAPISDLVVQPSAEDPNEATLYYPMLALFILVPVLEEIYYRGFLFTVFEETIGPRWGLCIVTLWFGLVHVPQIGSAVGAILVVAVAGALFTWLRYRYGSLIPSLVCHVAYNGVIVLLGLIESGV